MSDFEIIVRMYGWLFLLIVVPLVIGIFMAIRKPRMTADPAILAGFTVEDDDIADPQILRGLSVYEKVMVMSNDHEIVLAYGEVLATCDGKVVVQCQGQRMLVPRKHMKTASGTQTRMR